MIPVCRTHTGCAPSASATPASAPATTRAALANAIRTSKRDNRCMLAPGREIARPGRLRPGDAAWVRISSTPDLLSAQARRQQDVVAHWLPYLTEIQKE